MRKRPDEENVFSRKPAGALIWSRAFRSLPPPKEIGWQWQMWTNPRVKHRNACYARMTRHGQAAVGVCFATTLMVQDRSALPSSHWNGLEGQRQRALLGYAYLPCRGLFVHHRVGPYSEGLVLCAPIRGRFVFNREMSNRLPRETNTLMHIHGLSQALAVAKWLLAAALKLLRNRQH